MKTAHALILVGLALTLMTGCDRKTAPPPSQPARVSATAAYEKFFGPAPTSDKGTCFAFVIYFPAARTPTKVVPFPFFSFDEATLKKIAIERLLGGMEIGSYRGEFLQPFPSGTRILSISESHGILTLTLSREFEQAIREGVSDHATRALSLTLRQFKGITAVRIQVEGNDKPLESPVDEGSVLPPAAPRLLSVTAMRDKGAREVEEVDAFFDRPVDVSELRMSSRDGTPFEGDLFHSVFDMAAVLKPKDPSRFKEGLPVRLHWKVVDKLGRPAEGDSVWPLEVRQHDH